MRSVSYWLIGASATATVLFLGVALVGLDHIEQLLEETAHLESYP